MNNDEIHQIHELISAHFGPNQQAAVISGSNITISKWVCLECGQHWQENPTNQAGWHYDSESDLPGTCRAMVQKYVLTPIKTKPL